MKKESNHLVRDGRVISQQTASYALLPQTPGTYTLPEIKLPWFNTKINRISYATIPARTLTVIPSTNPLTPTAPAIAEPQTASSNELSDTPTNVQTVMQVTTPVWLIIVAIVGYGLWLITLVLYIKKRPQQSAAEPLPTSGSSVSLNELKQFAKQNNSSGFYNALNLYAKQQTGKNAAAIECLLASLKNTQLNDEIAKLRTKLYSSADEQVDLSLIVSLLSQTAKQTKSTSNATELKNLYD